jgi:hypothetical protein
MQESSRTRHAIWTWSTPFDGTTTISEEERERVWVITRIQKKILVGVIDGTTKIPKGERERVQVIARIQKKILVGVIKCRDWHAVWRHARRESRPEVI